MPDPSVLIVYAFFFGILVFLLARTALAERKSRRLLFACTVFAWTCLIYQLAGWARSLGYNLHYSLATSVLLNSCAGALEEGRHEDVTRELRQLTDEFRVTYENRGDFMELALKAVNSLSGTQAQEQKQKE
ncbi:MAG TPA: hypothetical protein DIT64_07635 [Verrucomicrobiales bacterium]|nr:hypothetical protein [Verrucomicrobiales bacterium]